MAKLNPFQIRLSCTYSAMPGEEWSAWVGFRPTRSGFSVWVVGDSSADGSSYRQLACKSKAKLNWSSACRAMLSISEGRLSGDFRRDVVVEGESGARAEVLAICWADEDEISDAVKEFLACSSESDVEWLQSALKGALTSDDSLALIGRYLDFDAGSPLKCWIHLFPDRMAADFVELVEVLERMEENSTRSAAAARAALLAPFAIGIEEAMTGTRGYMVGATSWAAGIASGMHTRRLRLTIERFVLKNGVLPSKADVEEFWRIEQLQPVSFQADKSFASR